MRPQGPQFAGRRRAVAVVAWVALAVAAAGQPPADPAGGRRHALLVGCTFYPNLPKRLHLQGPGNDLPLVRKLLTEQLGFRPESVAALSEQEGKDKGAGGLPTRANIEREFRRLAETAKAGDRVFILLGGHGSQQPEAEKSDEPEPDGLDEIFLPRDVGAWDGRKAKVENAITDNELGRWLKAIRAKGASVWIVLDSCHSGTMTRDVGVEVPRQVSATDALRIPAEAMRQARLRAALRAGGEKTRGGPTETVPLKLGAEGGLVAVYAAMPQEVTFERPMPPRTEGVPTHGLLSYTLCQVLTRAAKESRPPTYQEVFDRLFQQYVAWGRSAPTPVLEGADRAREVFGEKSWTRREFFPLTKGDKAWQVAAGALHGLTPGSVLAAYPPEGEGDKVVGHVRLTEIGPTTAAGVPAAFAGLPAVAELPNGGRAKVAAVDFGDQRLRLGLDPAVKGDGLPGTAWQQLGIALHKHDANDPRIEFVTDPAKADWLVHVRDRQAFLARANAGTDGLRFGPAPLDDKFGPWLRERLERVARAEALKKLAAAPADAGSEVRVKVEVRRGRDASDPKGTAPVAGGGSETLHDGEQLLLHLSNTGKEPADVTLLYVDSQYGIHCVFPERGEYNRLRPREGLALPLKVEAHAPGLEHLVVIAVKGEGTATDFGFLEQPALEKAPTRGKGALRGLESPLGRLFRTGVYGEGRTRSLAQADLESSYLRVYSWRVAPSKRP